jgi:hypothetical protein
VFSLLSCLRVLPVYDIRKVTGDQRKKIWYGLVSFLNQCTEIVGSVVSMAGVWIVLYDNSWCLRVICWYEHHVFVVRSDSKKYSTDYAIQVLGWMFGKVTSVSILSTYVLCEVSLGKTQK